MSRTISTLYHQDLPDLSDRISECLARGCQRAKTPPRIFFRADDIGYPSAGFTEMTNSFLSHELPLCLAVVPVWLNSTRMQELDSSTRSSELFILHQHGYSHHNHEETGKKQEFGPSRPLTDIQHDLIQGSQRLERLLGDRFVRVFTPPWNRCTSEAIATLRELGFQALSTSTDKNETSPKQTGSLIDFAINTDLHTKKNKTGQGPEGCLTGLLAELEDGLASGCAGVMLHHQRMNRRAFVLLNTLLEAVRKQSGLIPTDFRQMLADVD